MGELIGKSLGSYRILEQIGVGGMATIYKAYQPGMDRYVAIKVLPHYLANDENFVKRFRREAQAIAKLEHPHILPVFDYGEHEGTTYIAMRYVEAGTLKEKMAQGQMSLAEINHIIGQVGNALDYAHRQGIIHRDIKPGNILIDDQDNTYLTDFGLARIMESSQQFTASGVSVGTPAYMSPEQGKGVKVDHRSDIYSLGIMLYEMVTGQVPYEAETPLAVLLKHITDPLPLPHKIKPSLPEPVELVVLRALAKEPDDRFQTANELAQALATAVNCTPSSENKPTQPAPPRPKTDPIPTEITTPATEQVSIITRAQRTWQTPRGKAIMIGATAVIFVLLGFLLNRLNRTNIAVTNGNLAEPTVPVVAEVVDTAVPSPTATLIAASPTPQPTNAPTPIPTQVEETTTPINIPSAQARAFAEPILAAIANVPPDYEDDFSDPSSGWQTGTGISGHPSRAAGETGYDDGEYFLRVEGTAGQELVCYGIDSFVSFPADLVLEIDGRFLPEANPENDDWQIQFRKWDFGGFYSFGIRRDGYLNLRRSENNEGFDLAEHYGAPVLAEPDTNHVQIIAVGSETAVYVNGETLFYVDDADYSPQYGVGSINLGVCNLGETVREVRWDNLKVWDIANLSAPAESETAVPVSDIQVTQLAVYEESSGSLAWLPDSQTLLIGGHDIDLYDAPTLQSTQKIRTGPARSLALSPDGTILAWENYESVHLWDVASWSELRALAGSSDTDDIAFSPDGATLATATGSTVKLWDVASGAELRTIPAESPLNTVTFSPDGRTVAAGGLGDIQLWDAVTGETVHTLTGHTNWVQSVAFSPDGSLLASGSVDGTVRLWDVVEGRQTHLLNGHTKQVDGIAFSPDGRLLASASWDLTVRLWDVTTGTELETLTGHSDWIHQAIFSPNGTMLASESNSQVRLWRIMEQ